ncbi:MAG TPA: hypothetical protein VGE55_01070 [Limnobacter sp.]|uniref:hypothetical protein n=1 Tax=Limnobacter sp. TaxID=2003368 RepID=UPI002EDB7B8E
MKEIAVVANDAGASNILFSILRDQGRNILGECTLHPVMMGPAANIWCHYFPTIDSYHDINSINVKLDGVVTGTGWSSSLEHEARVWASQRSIKTIALLDHWVNYTSRFIRNGVMLLPDEIWVVDEWAEKMAHETFRNVVIRRFENSYLTHQVAKIQKPPADGTLLYVLEPARADWGRGRLGEFQALEYTLKNLGFLFNAPIRRILLRPHPSDPRGKYDGYLQFDSRIELNFSTDICDAINQADVVVGAESFALTLALAAGRPVFSSLPPWGPELRLPQEGILQIRHIVPT